MRLVSFTFDDGLIESAKKIQLLKIPSTFYLVTGWVTKELEVKDKFNLGLNHGDIKEWKYLNKKGLDIGSHSHKHEKIKNKEEFKKDIFKSIEIIKSNFECKFYNFSFPYGQEKFECKGFNSWKTGFVDLYNKIGRKKISSYNPFYDNKNTNLSQAIEEMPDKSWLVLTFHGIDEGWLPCTEDYLSYHHELCIKNKIKVVTVSDALDYKKFL